MLSQNIFGVSLGSDNGSLRLTICNVPTQLAKFVIGDGTS